MSRFPPMPATLLAKHVTPMACPTCGKPIGKFLYVFVLSKGARGHNLTIRCLLVSPHFRPGSRRIQQICKVSPCCFVLQINLGQASLLRPHLSWETCLSLFFHSLQLSLFQSLASKACPCCVLSVPLHSLFVHAVIRKTGQLLRHNLWAGSCKCLGYRLHCCILIGACTHLEFGNTQLLVS